MCHALKGLSSTRVGLISFSRGTSAPSGLRAIGRGFKIRLNLSLVAYGALGKDVSLPPSGCAQQNVSSGVDTWTGQHSEGGGA